MLHVMLDLYGCDPELLANEALLREVLEEYPNRIDMVKVGPAELRYIKTSSPLDDGYSGFVIIATSHVSLHAWAPYRMINIDVFSCEEFSVETVVAFACETFQTNDVEVHAVRRATRSPRISPREQPPVGMGERAEQESVEEVEGREGEVREERRAQGPALYATGAVISTRS